MLSEKKEKEKADPGTSIVRIVQITDPHLFADQNKTLAGLNCQDSFEEVLALVRRQQGDVLDILLCTGDITQEASIEAYQRFYTAMESFGVPHRWIPGNHDEPEILLAAVGQQALCLEKVFDIAGWRIIMLDSSVAGQVHGRLAAVELDFLREALDGAQRLDRHVLVCVHHNPLPVKAKWLQQHALQNSDDFFAVIDQFPVVRAVVWGHVHQEVDQKRKGVRMLAAPSTCVQFHPDNDEFSLDRRNPGYRWLELLPDGTLHSAVERVSGVTFNVDFSSTGY